jgi:ABC-type phosphate/phosphonate transport system substrate-binding protein
MMAAPRAALEQIFAHIGVSTALDEATWGAMLALFAGGAADAQKACTQGGSAAAGCDRGLHVSSRTAGLLAPEAADELRRLYAPFNADLAQALGDDAWRWE